MMNHPNKILFLVVLISSLMLTISSNNWIGVWVGLEINLMSFIPLVFKSKSTQTAEGCTMYFLVQTISSMILMFAINIETLSTIDLNTNKVQIMMLISMLIKMGMPPFHSWFVLMMKKMEWNTCMLLMTLQKMAPMMIMSYLSFNTSIIMVASIVSAVSAINQTDLRKMMALSSINHLSWMMTCMMMSNTWLVYLAIYSMMTILLTTFFNKNNILHISQMNKMCSNLDKTSMSIMMMSMGGLPPFIGFFPKWMAINLMVHDSNIILMTVMMITSLITLFYYMRIMSVLMMKTSTNIKWSMTTPKTQSQHMLTINVLMPIMLMMYS